MRRSFSKLALIISSFFIIGSSFGNSHENEEEHKEGVEEIQLFENDRLNFVNMVDPNSVIYLGDLRITPDEILAIKLNPSLDEGSHTDIKYTKLQLEAIRINDPEDGIRDVVYDELKRYGKDYTLPGLKVWAKRSWPDLYLGVEDWGESIEGFRDKRLAVVEERNVTNDDGERVVGKRLRAHLTAKGDGTVAHINYNNFDHIGFEADVRFDGRVDGSMEYREEFFGYSPSLDFDIEPFGGDYEAILGISIPPEDFIWSIFNRDPDERPSTAYERENSFFSNE